MDIMKILECISRKKSWRSSKPMVELWNDMPETFPVSSIYKQSFLHPVSFASVITAGLIVEVAGTYLFRDLHHQQASSGMTTFIQLSVYLSQFAVPFIAFYLFLKWNRRRWAVQNRRIQVFINRYQMNALGPCLSLVDAIIKGRRQTHITDRVIMNLKVLLHDAGNRPPVVLTGLQRAVLCGLVDPDNVAGYGGKLTQSQRQKLVVFGLALSTPAITAMRTIGGVDSIAALQNRLNKTESSRIRGLVCDSLKRIDPRLEFSYETPKSKLNARLITRMSLDVGHLPGDSSKVSALHKPHFYIGTLLAVIAVFSALMYLISGSDGYGLLFFSSIFAYPFGYMPYSYYKIHQFRKLLFTYACQDNPVALRYLLTSYYGEIPFAASDCEYLLIMNETVQNLTSENAPVLNRLQIGRYHRLIEAGSQIQPVNSDDGNPLPVIDCSSGLVAKLSLLGDERSVGYLESVMERCPHPAMQQAAKASLPALKTRLAITPQEMLRSSPAPGGDLLHPSTGEAEEVLLRSVTNGTSADQGITGSRLEESAEDTLKVVYYDLNTK